MQIGDKRYEVVDFCTIMPTSCPCGSTRRAFVDDPDQVASIHRVEIKEDADLHYHKRLTEIYYILSGDGHMELDGDLIPVQSGSAILIKPGCRHRAVGKLEILNIPIPAFDKTDEYFD